MDFMAVLPAFLIAVFLISASPGPAMALILRRAALDGWRGAVPTVLGLELGLYLWALLAAAGFAALVAASEVAFIVLKVVGSVVLLYLGVRAWIGLWRTRAVPGTPQGDSPDPLTTTKLSGRVWAARFGERVIVQLANPKAAVFMIAFYPQFIPAGQPLFATTAVLALLQVTLETVFYLSLAMGVSRAGAWFRKRVIQRRIEAISGAVLVGLGLRTALAQR